VVRKVSSIEQSFVAPFQRGLFALARGDFALACDFFERARRLAPERAEVAYALGRERMRAGRYEEAESLLSQAWQSDRSLLSAAAALARCLGLHMNRFARAREVLKEAARSASAPVEQALLQVVQAELALEQGFFEEARAAAKEALQAASPDSTIRDAASAALARVENQDGVELANTGQNEASLFSFKRAHHFDPAWGAPLVNMGVAFAKLKKLDQAERSYRLALQIDSENPSAHANLGRLYLQRGDHWQALSCFERALALDPTDLATLLVRERTEKRLYHT
jgi:tetratricopeptide (TPR) repeat protein